MATKLIIAPHIDDDVLGCGGIMDDDTHVLYCGMDESSISHAWVRERPSIEDRVKETKAVEDFLGHTYTVLFNQVNHYTIQELIPAIEFAIQKHKPDRIYIPHPSYNQDHRVAYEAALTALRPHDLNHFVKKVLVYEQPHVFLWNHNYRSFTPTYFVPIDIERKIAAYKLMKSQVREFRSPEMLEALALLRGKQSNLEYAEAFEVLRWVE